MLEDDIKIIDFLHRRDFFPDDNGAWNRIKKKLVELAQQQPTEQNMPLKLQCPECLFEINIVEQDLSNVYSKKPNTAGKF